jgi:hypothetical protein
VVFLLISGVCIFLTIRWLSFVMSGTKSITI